jgi:quercetin dioxygenase-like cupin family protein
VRLLHQPRSLGTLAASLSLIALITSCHSAPAHVGTTFVGSHGDIEAQPLLLQESEGERRVHRPPPAALSNLAAPFIIKLDRRNGGAPEFVMLMEDIAPGQAIPPHKHPHSDEILFVRDGSGVAVLGGKEAKVLAGATIYMPRNTSVRLQNTGTEPLRIIAIFSQPGYENYMREISVPEGEAPKPLTVEELTAIRARYHADVVYDQP